MDELQADLCDFIVEIRKENGEQYPSSSMYDLILGLSLYLDREHGFTDKLVSGASGAVRNTLDNVTKERTAEGVGCCDMGQNDTIGKIELNPSFVLSSDNTNYKNDIQ